MPVHVMGSQSPLGSKADSLAPRDAQRRVRDMGPQIRGGAHLALSGGRSPVQAWCLVFLPTPLRVGRGEMRRRWAGRVLGIHIRAS